MARGWTRPGISSSPFCALRSRKGKDTAGAQGPAKIWEGVPCAEQLLWARGGVWPPLKPPRDRPRDPPSRPPSAERSPSARSFLGSCRRGNGAAPPGPRPPRLEMRVPLLVTQKPWPCAGVAPHGAEVQDTRCPPTHGRWARDSAGGQRPVSAAGSEGCTFPPQMLLDLPRTRPALWELQWVGKFMFVHKQRTG